MRRWEFVGGKSEKFWESGLSGTAVTTRYGRIATNGQTAVKQFESTTEAASYLARLIAEKEKKGYAEVAETPDPAPAAVPDSVTRAPETGPTPKTELPDEETFEFPGSWRRVLHPRRGGVARPPAEVNPDDVAEVGKWTREGEHLVRQVLAEPNSDQQLVKELQAHVDGAASPRGAAMVAQLVATRHYLDRGKLADAWVAAHGLVFTARTVMELCEVQIDWNSGLSRKNAPWLEFRPAGEPLGWHWQWRPAAERLRALLACAAERDYRAVVEALAGHRTTEAQRVIAAYLVPTETEWVDDCCVNPPAGNDNAVSRTLLFCALGSPEQVAALGPHARFGWGQWSLDILATAADGVGTSVAPMLVDALDEDSGGADARKMVLNALSRLPTDEAFQIMVDRIDQKYVQPALLEAMRRFPVRALRLLAQAAGGHAKSSASALRLLTGHLLTEAELVAAVLPGLPGEVRAVVAEASESLVRVEEAPAESLPGLLAEPPWTRKRKVVAPAVVTGLEPTAEAELSWRPGEKDEWAATTSYYGRWVDKDWDAAVRRYHDPDRPAIPGHEEVALFMNGPERLVRPLLAEWKPRYPWSAETWMKPIVAKYGTETINPVLDVAAGNPASTGSLLLPFRDVRVARLMADWLIRLKSARKVALTWFGRHGVEAARLLVPDAVGPAGKPRAGAEAALRLVATASGDAATRIRSKRRARSVETFSTQSLRRSVCRAVNRPIAALRRVRRFDLCWARLSLRRKRHRRSASLAPKPGTDDNSPLESAAETATPRSRPTISPRPGPATGGGMTANATCQRPARSRLTRNDLTSPGMGRDQRNRTQPTFGTHTSPTLRDRRRASQWPPRRPTIRNPSCTPALRQVGRRCVRAKKFATAWAKSRNACCCTVWDPAASQANSFLASVS